MVKKGSFYNFRNKENGFINSVISAFNSLFRMINIYKCINVDMLSIAIVPYVNYVVYAQRIFILNYNI